MFGWGRLRRSSWERTELRRWGRGSAGRLVHGWIGRSILRFSVLVGLVFIRRWRGRGLKVWIAGLSAGGHSHHLQVRVALRENSEVSLRDSKVFN